MIECERDSSEQIEDTAIPTIKINDEPDSIGTPLQIPPVVDFAYLSPTSKARELKNTSDSFASHSRNLFSHHVTPVVAKRRDLLFALGKTKEIHSKTAARLWPLLSSQRVFLCTEAAKSLRSSMKDGVLGQEEGLRHAGFVRERILYVLHAKIAVADYQGRKPNGGESSSFDETCGRCRGSKSKV